MAGIPRLAWRNLGRNRRRSLTTGAALAFGISLCVASFGLVDGLNAQLLDALTKLDLGHVQIHQRDFAKRRKLEHAISGADTMLSAAEKLPAVRAATARSYAYALVSAGRRSAGVELVGIDPTREPNVTALHERIVRGKYLDTAPTPWPRGRKLTDEEKAVDEELTQAAEDDALAELDDLETLDDAEPDSSSEPAREAAPDSVATAAPTAAEPAAADTAQPTEAQPPKPPARAPPPTDGAAKTHELALALSPPPARPPRVFIGASLAKVLGVDVGSQLYVTAQTADSQAESVFLEVAGVFETGTQIYDRTRLYLHLADLQRLVHLDEQPHEIAVVARSSQQAQQIASALGPSVENTEAVVRSWNEIRPDIKQMLELNSVSTGLMVFIIFIVATLGVVNTMLMAVFERTRELGVLKAIGMSGKKIVALIITETLFLVLVSSVVGTGIGLALDGYMVHYGVDLSSVTGGISMGGMGVDPVIYGVITPEGVLLPTIILAATCFAASFYPAVRAARLQPAVGMRET